MQATHSEGASVTYSIDHDSMVVNPTLEAVRDSAFILNSVTGLLTLNIQPTAAMEGMFEFGVVATDPGKVLTSLVINHVEDTVSERDTSAVWRHQCLSTQVIEMNSGGETVWDR